MNKNEIEELREALMQAHVADSSESLDELKYYNTPNTSPANTRPETFAPISMGSQRPITGNKRSRSAMDSGLSLAELQKQLGHHSDSSDDEMKGYNKAIEKEKKKKRRTVKLRGKKRGGKRKRNRKKRTRRRRKSRRRMRGKRKGKSRKKRGGINKLFPVHLLSETGKLHYASNKFIMGRLHRWWASISIERQENIINRQHNHFAFQVAMDNLIGLAMHEEQQQQQQQNQQGGHAGNSSSSNRQPNYEELAAMREANPQRVYYLYIINSNSDPPLVAPVGNGFTHEFKLNTNGDKIAITGHRVGHHNQNPAYTIPNPANNNTPPAIEVANNFYNPAPGVSREFRDISDMMGNLQMGGSGIKSTIEGNGCDFLPHHKLCKGGRRKKGGEVKPIDLAKAKKELRDEFKLKYMNINSRFDDLNNSVDELRIRIGRGGRRKKRTRRRRKSRRKSKGRKRRKSRRKRR